LEAKIKPFFAFWGSFYINLLDINVNSIFEIFKRKMDKGVRIIVYQKSYLYLTILFLYL
jgi:hypothetical protein